MSRYSDSTLVPTFTPRPPCICKAMSITRWAFSVAVIFAMAAATLRSFIEPCCVSRIQAAR